MRYSISLLAFFDKSLNFNPRSKSGIYDPNGAIVQLRSDNNAGFISHPNVYTDEGLTKTQPFPNLALEPHIDLVHVSPHYFV